MKIALVIPPLVDFYFTPQRSSFLGIHTIAQILAAGNIEHRIFNGIRGRGRKIPLPPELSYLSPYIGREGFFKSYNRFGITDDQLAAEIKDYLPDAVFISCFAFCYAAETISIINAVKKILPRVPVIAGGAGVTVYPEYFLRRSNADCAVRGEAGKALPDILHGLTSITGVHTGAGNGESGTHSPVMIKMRESGDTIWYSAMITRGCPLSCTFCSVGQVFPRFEKPPLELVDVMFAELAGKNKRVHVNLEDDNLTLDFEYFARILGILERHTGGNFSFSMENGTEFRGLDRPKLRFMKEYNLKQLNLSLVSSNQNILEENGRLYSTGLFEKIAAMCGELSIPVITYLITGLPGEDVNSIHAGIDFIEQLPVRMAVSTFYPVPGIHGYRDRTFFDGFPPRLCAGSSFYPWNLCTSDELVRIFLRVRSISPRTKSIK